MCAVWATRCLVTWAAGARHDVAPALVRTATWPRGTNNPRIIRENKGEISVFGPRDRHPLGARGTASISPNGRVNRMTQRRACCSPVVIAKVVDDSRDSPLISNLPNLFVAQHCSKQKYFGDIYSR